MKTNIERVKFWCYKVLPLVYDESLSYYEVLCKTIAKLNEVITSENALSDHIEEIDDAIKTIQKWIDNFDYSVIGEWLQNQFLEMIFVEITDSGYFKLYIPETWSDLTFNTTGWDIFIDGYSDGHLVLSY